MFTRGLLNKEFFSSSPDLTTVFNSSRVTQHETSNYAIESLSTLEKLLTEKRERKEKHAVLRFLVDTSGTAWFARETHPGIDSPKHFQMTGALQKEALCHTAGNIKFTNAACRKLKNINHKSGDFKPSFHSLKLFIAILVLNEAILPFKLPRTLTIKELDSSGALLKKHRWSVVQIKKWLDTFVEDAVLIKAIKNQNHETKSVRYESNIKLSGQYDIDNSALTQKKSSFLTLCFQSTKKLMHRAISFKNQARKA